MNVSSQNISLIQILTKIFKNLSLRRKKQLGVLSTLILISSTCEILILSSVQPFLLALEKSNNNNIINKSNGYFSQIFFNDQQSLISLLLILHNYFYNYPDKQFYLIHFVYSLLLI